MSIKHRRVIYWEPSNALDDRIGEPRELRFPEGWTLSEIWERAQTEEDRGAPVANDAEYIVWLEDGDLHRVVFALSSDQLLSECTCDTTTVGSARTWRRAGGAGSVADSSSPTSTLVGTTDTRPPGFDCWTATTTALAAPSAISRDSPRPSWTPTSRVNSGRPAFESTHARPDGPPARSATCCYGPGRRRGGNELTGDPLPSCTDTCRGMSYTLPFAPVIADPCGDSRA